MITASEMRALEDGRAIIVQDRCRVYVGHPDDARHSADRAFIMVKPGGRHTLRVACTDLARLNAHWEGFIRD